MLAHPDVYARVMPEIDDLFSAGPVTWERMSSMPAFCGAVMEALRLYPVAALVPREAARDFEFAGCQIRKGDPLFIGNTVTHMDPSLFRDPERFDIDRYATPRSEHKTPGAYAPSGLGAHRCLAGNMGELQAMIVAARLLHKLDLAIHPRDYELTIVSKPLRRPDRRFRLRVAGWRRPG